MLTCTVRSIAMHHMSRPFSHASVACRFRGSPTFQSRAMRCFFPGLRECARIDGMGRRTRFVGSSGEGGDGYGVGSGTDKSTVLEKHKGSVGHQQEEEQRLEQLKEKRSSGRFLWVAVKGGRRPMKIEVSDLHDVNDFVKRIKEEAAPRLDGVGLDNIQLFASQVVQDEEGGEPFRPWLPLEDISVGNTPMMLRCTCILKTTVPLALLQSEGT